METATSLSFCVNTCGLLFFHQGAAGTKKWLLTLAPIVVVAPDGGHRDVEVFGFISFCCSDILHLIWFILWLVKSNIWHRLINTHMKNAPFSHSGLTRGSHWGPKHISNADVSLFLLVCPESNRFFFSLIEESHDWNVLPAVHFTAALLLIYLFFLSLGDVISAGNEVNINCLPLREDAEQILIRKYFIFFFFSPLDKDICATSPHRKAHPFLRKAHKPLADGFFFSSEKCISHLLHTLLEWWMLYWSCYWYFFMLRWHIRVCGSQAARWEYKAGLGVLIQGQSFSF